VHDRTILDSTATIADVIEVLEREIADRQRALALLKAICSDALKGSIGRPRKYDVADEARIAALIAEGKTHRAISAMLSIPVASIGKIASRLSAKRETGDLRGGPRVKGRINHNRKHQALKRS
jgi:hypothetical protein